MNTPIQGSPNQWFEAYKDQDGNLLISLNKDGSIFCQGVGFAAGGGLLVGPIPVIQTSEDLIATLTTGTITATQALTTLYQVTFYYGPSDATGAGTWSPSVSWQDPAGNNLILAYPYLGPATAGNVENYQSYSIPFFVKGGTPITVTGTYSGGGIPVESFHPSRADAQQCRHCTTRGHVRSGRSSIT